MQIFPRRLLQRCMFFFIVILLMPKIRHVVVFFFSNLFAFLIQGDKCAYSHDAADSHRKAELCKFYQQGYCKKNLHCNLLHGEYPCKAFHKGECTKDQCQFSHEPLNDFTRPIFEQVCQYGLQSVFLLLLFSITCVPVLL